jgi:hypothetical protein
MGLGFVNTIGSPSQAQGPNLTASNTRTTIMPTTAKQTVPTQFFDRPGKQIRFLVNGRLSNIITTPGTLTLDITFAAVQVWNSGAIQLSAVAHTTLPFWLEVLMTCRTIGASTVATVMSAGLMCSQCIIPAIGVVDAGSHNTLIVPNVTPVVSSGFDSTILNAIDLFATFSLNNANAIAVEQFSILEMN